MFEEREQLNGALLSLKEGNAEALDFIFELAGKRMYALALGVVKNPADAEDVLSDSFLKLARGVRSFRAGTNGYAFVMRIVRNAAFDLLRKRKVRAEEDIDGFFHLSDGRYSPERREDAMELERAIARLGAEEKKLIYLKYYLDETVREIAAELGISKSAAGRKLQQAEQKLKEILGQGEV